jgi:hypothetical protein
VRSGGRRSGLGFEGSALKFSFSGAENERKLCSGAPTSLRPPRVPIAAYLMESEPQRPTIELESPSTVTDSNPLKRPASPETEENNSKTPTNELQDTAKQHCQRM